MGGSSYPRSGGWCFVMRCRGSTTAQIDLDTPKANAIGGVGGGIDALEHPPAPALSFQDNGLALFAELHQMQMVASPHRGGGDQGLGKPTLVKRPLRLQFSQINTRL